MEFILLMDRIKCWYNTPLQVLTNVPSLHSLIVRRREDVADILKFFNHIHGDLRKLILEICCLGDDGTLFLENIVDLYPALEVLTLQSCYPLTNAGYSLIPRLTKLSELNLLDCWVNYVCVELLESHVCMYESL
jgi:hypothetical protein